MRELLVQMKQTAELGDNEVNSVISLKQQYWAYDTVKQIIWFRANLLPDDLHLMVTMEGTLIAYLNAVNVDVTVDQSLHRMLGIGNVCVDRKHAHTGLGGILMACINAHIRQTQCCGILLCRRQLIGFYDKFDWKKYDAETVYINGQPYEHFIMTFDPGKRIPKDGTTLIEISRNF